MLAATPVLRSLPPAVRTMMLSARPANRNLYACRASAAILPFWAGRAGCAGRSAGRAVKTHALFFPFDLFGHPGTRMGAELLADAVQEMLRDNRREKMPTRARAYTNKIHVDELLLETLADYQD